MFPLETAGLFILTALAEIIGYFLPFQSSKAKNTPPLPLAEMRSRVSIPVRILSRW